MVGTTDNDTDVNYKLVQADDEIIPAFSLTTICYDSSSTELPNFPGSTSFHNLTIPKPTPLSELIQSVQTDSGLEGRWMGEVINLEQDNVNETTRITLNFVQILPLDSSSCEGNFDIAGNLKLCRPTKGLQISCVMNTHVEYVEYITAGCKTCSTRGITGTRREKYSSPKPVYGEYMHGLLASYGGSILIPQCMDTVNFGGCLAHNTTSVDLVKDKFVELLRGITASGVIARRILLSGKGEEMNVQLLIKGETGVRIKFGIAYWITILSMTILCFFGIASYWFFTIYRNFQYYSYQIFIPAAPAPPGGSINTTNTEPNQDDVSTSSTNIGQDNASANAKRDSESTLSIHVDTHEKIPIT
jgi:hypothetical protein